MRMPITLVAAWVETLVRCMNKARRQSAAAESQKTSEAKAKSKSAKRGGVIGSGALIVAILCSSAALAKDYEWKDARVIDITAEKGGTVVTPIAALVGVSVSKTFYWIQTDDMIYVLGPVVAKRQLLNVTMYETTKVAIDGNNAHILDDYGKDKKLPVVEKVVRPKPEVSR